MIDVIIREVKMPYCINGYTKLDEDGDYNIYINEDLSDEMKTKTIRHEVEHAERGDFSSLLPVELLEASNQANNDLKDALLNFW